MTRNFPSIYGFSIENIRLKIEFYDSIGFHFLAIVSPKNLMQSSSLSFARYMFLTENGISMDETNYKILFYELKTFEKKYGVKNEDLLAKYDYEKYLEEKSTQELGKESKEALEDTPYIDATEREIAIEERNLANQTNEEHRW